MFRVFDQDAEIVIDVINYLIERAEDAEQSAIPPKKKESKSDVLWDYV